jgi:predicted transcriptional regulator
MRKSRREHINRLADSIRVGCELDTPVNVLAAVERLGGQLVEEDDADFEAKVERSGTGFRISLGPQPHEQRRRFSIAHELGHLFLHMGYLIDETKWQNVGVYTDSVYYRFGYGTEEFEANEFAASLLMPSSEFLQVAQQSKFAGLVRPQVIADHFQVSVEAAVNRGRWLGIFSWE